MPVTRAPSIPATGRRAPSLGVPLLVGGMLAMVGVGARLWMEAAPMRASDDDGPGLAMLLLLLAVLAAAVVVATMGGVLLLFERTWHRTARFPTRERPAAEG